MEQRRFILFIVLSSLILFGWMIGGPILFPGLFRPQQPEEVAADDPQEAPDEGAQQPGEEESPVDDAEPREVAVEEPPAEQTLQVAEFDSHPVTLGSLDPESGFFFEVEIESRGAAIETITLNDERYIAEVPRGALPEQLKIVGNSLNTDLRTLETRIGPIDDLLEQVGTSLNDVDWEIDQEFVDQHTDPATGIVRGVRYRFPSPDGSLEVVKTYEVHQSTWEQRDVDANGYLIDFFLEIRNLTDGELAAGYELTGPVGVPLENVENTRTFIEVKAGIAEDPADPKEVTDTDKRTAATVVEEENAGDLEPWRAPLRYVGVDVQFFAALLIPAEAQHPDAYFEAATPFVVFQDPNEEHHSDVSIRMASNELTIAPGGDVVHSFQLFAGPKRSELLAPFGAEGVINYGWFGTISVWMVSLLEFFHEFLLLPYGLAIVLLTLIVRACMFPITRKQAKGAKKMKELQPELTRLKEKYGKEPEEFWKAQRELFRKHNYHPLAGCLPLFLQMPIFFGLYSALNMAVDLRMVPFLWIDNLAAPDALFPLGFTIPFLGWTEFNLLPLVTISLWIVQQKMFMPPAATEEAAMQQKMMTYMMVFFGFMIYRVPAGLCVYFITSTLWGLTERKILDFGTSDDEKRTEAAIEEKSSGRKDDEPDAPPKEPGFFQRLLEAADQAKEQTNGQRTAQPARERDGGGRKKGGKKRKKSRR